MSGRTNLNDERCLMLRVLSQFAAVLVFTTALGAAPGNSTPDSLQGAPGQTQETIQPIKTRKLQVGKASWYGRIFQHKQTASGEPYDMYQFTAAHRTLPLGSWVKVTDLKNDRSVIVRINDRGPVIEEPHHRSVLRCGQDARYEPVWCSSGQPRSTEAPVIAQNVGPL